MTRPRGPGPGFVVVKESRPSRAWCFDLPLPPSANNLFHTGSDGRRHRSKGYNAWLAEAGAEFVMQWARRPPGVRTLSGPFSILCEVGRFADRRKRDLFNREKGLLDMLVAHAAVLDDSLAECGTFRWSDAVPQGRIRVTLEEEPRRGMAETAP